MIQTYIFVLPHKTLTFTAVPAQLLACIEDIRDRLFWDQPGQHQYSAYFFKFADNFQDAGVFDSLPGIIFLRFIKRVPYAPQSKESYVHVHVGIGCNSCGIKPIIGERYTCSFCPNFNTCELCEHNRHHGEHTMVRVAETKIYCNECGLPAAVFGYFYKCQICPNFYLCMACEMRHAHNCHEMIRLTL